MIMSFLCDDKGRPSSRRAIALVIVIVVLVAYMHAEFTDKTVPSVTEFLMGSAVTLLVSDPVAKAVNKRINKNENYGENSAECNAEPEEQSQQE